VEVMAPLAATPPSHLSSMETQNLGSMPRLTVLFSRLQVYALPEKTIYEICSNAKSSHFYFFASIITKLVWVLIIQVKILVI
jgi:hypothetical protein